MSINVRDLATRSFHTFWQAFIAVLGVTWAASGVDVSQINDVDSAKKIGLAALTAVGAAALSALKTTVKSFTDAPAVSEDDDPEPDDILPEPIAGPVTATQAQAVTAPPTEAG